MWLNNEFIKSLCLGAVPLSIRNINVTMTNYWLEDSLLMDEAALEGRMEQFLAYLAREKSLKHWLDEQYISALYDADVKLGLRRDVVKVWNVSEEDPIEAAATIEGVEGWFFAISSSSRVSGGPRRTTIE